MTANNDLRDIMLSHQIGLHRRATNITNRILAILRRSDSNISDELRQRLARIQERGFDLGPATTARLETLQSNIRDILNDVHGEIGELIRAEMVALANYEAEFTVAAVARVLPVTIELAMPPRPILRSAALSRPFQGRFLREWLRDFSVGDRRRVRSTIAEGIVEGRTIPQMISSVIGSNRLRRRDGVRQITRRNAEAMVRTATNHTSNRARELTLRENNDIVRGVLYVATLDGRTTAVCRALDQRVFPINSGPRPPQHVNCRSTIVVALDGNAIADRPAVADKRTRRTLDRDLRRDARARLGDDEWLSLNERQRRAAIRDQRDIWARQNIGNVPAETSYQEWIRTQPVGFQNQVLGTTKARLFRDGGLTLDRFVDPTGREYTLDELRIRDAEAFQRAGID